MTLQYLLTVLLNLLHTSHQIYSDFAPETFTPQALLSRRCGHLESRPFHCVTAEYGGFLYLQFALIKCGFADPTWCPTVLAAIQIEVQLPSCCCSSS